jgi:hypothetical protein
VDLVWKATYRQQQPTNRAEGTVGLHELNHELLHAARHLTTQQHALSGRQLALMVVRQLLLRGQLCVPAAFLVPPGVDVERTAAALAAHLDLAGLVASAQATTSRHEQL